MVGAKSTAAPRPNTGARPLSASVFTDRARRHDGAAAKNFRGSNVIYMEGILEKFNENYFLLEEMYADAYYPKFLVDKLRIILLDLVIYLSEDPRGREEIREKLDEIIIMINSLREEFRENDSEFESFAHACVASDLEYILRYFSVNIDPEEAARGW
jgi:hypothetical protein